MTRSGQRQRKRLARGVPGILGVLAFAAVTAASPAQVSGQEVHTGQTEPTDRLSPVLAPELPAFAPLQRPRFDPPLEPPATVLRVPDGGTVVVFEHGERVVVRLQGVRAPGAADRPLPSEADALEDYAHEATVFARNLLHGERVFVVRSADGRLDRAGRPLAMVYRADDGLCVNLEVVRQGYGRVDDRYRFMMLDLFRDHERRARKAKKGLWLPGHLRDSAPHLDPACQEDTQQDAAPGESEPDARTVEIEPVSARQPKRETPSDRDAEKPAPSAGVRFVFRTPRGTRYHSDGCRHVRNLGIQIALSDAAKAGLTACTVCDPPALEAGKSESGTEPQSAPGNSEAEGRSEQSGSMK